MLSYKTHRSINLFFSSIFAFQIAVFIILMIQTSDSNGFKALVGFVGIPMAVSSVVMGLVNSAGSDKQTKVSWIKILTLLSLIYVVFKLTLLFFSNYNQFHLLYEASVNPGSVALLSSLAGGIIVGLRVMIINPAKEGIGFTIARAVLIILFLIIFVKIYYPIFAFFISVITHNTSLLSMVGFTKFNSSLIASLGNIFEWHIDFIVAIFIQYRFYHNFWWIGSINNANKKADENS